MIAVVGKIISKVSKRKQLDSFLKYLSQEVEEAKEKGEKEIRVYADKLPNFLVSRYGTGCDIRRCDKKKTEKRIGWARVKIQDKFFYYKVVFTTSMLSTTTLVIEF